MFGILARLIEWFYTIWPSYGGAIVLFTIAIMVVLAPLTFKSTRSMLAMQALQPELKKLQNRYRDDRQKLNEEMMKFYRENKISPLGGCLPMLIQLPVFFILYAVLLGLTRRGPFGADLGHSVACSMGGTNACVDVGNGFANFANAGFFHPAYLEHSSSLYRHLSGTRVMDSFGLDLSQSAWGIFPRGIVDAIPYLVMVLVVMGLTYLQQQQIQSRQPKKTLDNPMQQTMMKVMPVAMGFVYIIIPAGVVVYFLVSSVFRVGQQAMVTRTFYTGPNAIVVPSGGTSTDGEGKRRDGRGSSGKGAGPGGKAPAGKKGGGTTRSGSEGGGKASKGSGGERTKRSGSPRSDDGAREERSGTGGRPERTKGSSGDRRPSAPSRKAPSRSAPRRPSSSKDKE